MDGISIQLQFHLGGGSLLIGGYDTVAYLAERGINDTDRHFWDRTATWLERSSVSHGTADYHQPDDWHALYYVGLHISVGHEQFPRCSCEPEPIEIDTRAVIAGLAELANS